MNGRKMLRCRAAVVGLALLMGASFLGCHAGPRFFAKKDRDERAAKKEFADKGKFINKKKIRPEADYLSDDELAEERVAKNDSKSKTKSPNADASRSRTTDEANRSIASRSRTEDSVGVKAKSASKGTAQPEIASRKAVRQPATREVEDSLFDEPLPEKKKTIARPTVVAKNRSLNEDPFKNTVVNPFDNKREAAKLAKVNFDDLEDDDAEEADEDELELPARAVKRTVVTAKKSADQRATAASSDLKRKFLPDDDGEGIQATVSVARSQTQQVEEVVDLPSPRVNRTASKIRGDVKDSVAANRQQVQQTISDWRSELDRQDSGEVEDLVPAMKTPTSTTDRRSRTVNSGHISQTTLDEFAPQQKSRGAVLNGDLIIDTSNVPTRFQRTPGSDSIGNGTNTGRGNANDSNGRTRPNSGASIDIVPGSTHSGSRSTGQITLQSLLNHDDETSSVEQAVYEQSSSDKVIEGLPSLAVSGIENGESGVAQSGSATGGPRLRPIDGEAAIEPLAAEMTATSPVERTASESATTVRGWIPMLLAIGGLAAAVLMGLTLRRRKEMLVPVPVRASKPERASHDSPYDPTSWPRG